MTDGIKMRQMTDFYKFQKQNKFRFILEILKLWCTLEREWGFLKTIFPSGSAGISLCAACGIHGGPSAETVCGDLDLYRSFSGVVCGTALFFFSSAGANFSVFQQDRQLDKQFEEDPTKAIKRVKQLIKQYQQAAKTAKQQFESELKSAQADVQFCLPFPSFFFEKSENALVFCCV